MTFKEFKKQNNLSKYGYSLEFDWDIYCDIAERAGYDPTDERMENHYGDHQGYLEEHDIDIWHNIIAISDLDFTKLEQLSDEAFLREYFFDNYTVETSYNDDEYGLVIKLVH